MLQKKKKRNGDFTKSSTLDACVCRHARRKSGGRFEDEDEKKRKMEKKKLKKLVVARWLETGPQQEDGWRQDGDEKDAGDGSKKKPGRR